MENVNNVAINNLHDKLYDIHACSSDVNQNDIDKLCNDLCDLLISPAIKSGVSKNV